MRKCLNSTNLIALNNVFSIDKPIRNSRMETYFKNCNSANSKSSKQNFINNHGLLQQKWKNFTANNTLHQNMRF